MNTYLHSQFNNKKDWFLIEHQHENIIHLDSDGCSNSSQLDDHEEEHDHNNELDSLDFD